ncbi:MAG: sensor protein kdpD [Pseudonocardiales bacterium]|nr:MAG: sensor protein kdpD [Pseudonocardiales bacterium]
MTDAPARLPRVAGGLTASRRLAGLALGAVGLPLCTVALTSLRSTLSLPSDLLIYLLVVVLIAVVGGVLPAVLAAVIASLLANFWFTPPYHTFTIAEHDHVLALVVFLVVAITVSVSVDVAARLRSRAERSGAEAVTLSRLAGGSGGALPEPSLEELLEQVRATFGMHSVALLRPSAVSGWAAVAAVGAERDWADGDGEIVRPAGDLRMVGSGPAMFAEDRRVLDAYAAAAARVADKAEQAQQAARARELAAVDRLRAALLAAVGHDLRTPLAGIKAAVSSLRQDDVAWTEEESAGLLATIEESTDRLADLVANLLDMSRVQAGALTVRVRPVALDEAVHGALIGQPGEPVEVDVPDSLPLVTADPGLLERVLVNVIANAVHFTPADRPVTVGARAEGTIARLVVADGGPGVPAADRDRMFAPFQRLHDRAGPAAGVGLGLAIARGFTEAMGGTLVPSDTPGGGLTMTLTLPVAR